MIRLSFMEAVIPVNPVCWNSELCGGACMMGRVVTDVLGFTQAFML